MGGKLAALLQSLLYLFIIYFFQKSGWEFFMVSLMRILPTIFIPLKQIKEMNSTTVKGKERSLNHCSKVNEIQIHHQWMKCKDDSTA